MTTFALKKIESICGVQQFHQLIVNGKAVLDDFEKSLETQHQSEFKTIIAYMNFIAELKTLPDKKFKDITPQNEIIKEYEFKSKHIRIYVIKQLNGKIVVLCGHKTTQKQDIKRFRKIKSDYLNSLNS